METNNLKLNSKIDRVILRKEKRNESIASLILEGWNQTEVAEEFEISRKRITEILKIYFPDIYEEIKGKQKHPEVEEKIQRNLFIYNLYIHGLKLKRLKSIFKISYSRIIQIIKKIMEKKKIIQQNDIDFLIEKRKILKRIKRKEGE